MIKGRKQELQIYTKYTITKYGSTLYIGMDEVLAHYACTFENSICKSKWCCWSYLQTSCVHYGSGRNTNLQP